MSVLLLGACMILDYITGLLAASHRGNAITSYRSISGIAKKVCSLLLAASRGKEHPQKGRRSNA